MKLIIAGSRTVSDHTFVRSKVNNILNWLNIKPTEVVSGCAIGADLAGESYATVMNIPITKMPADWNKYKKAAGVIRNSEMADYGDIAIVFWDGKSPGSKNMISQMNKRNKICIVVMVENV